MPETQVPELADVISKRSSPRGGSKLYQYFDNMDDIVEQLPDKLTGKPWYSISKHFEGVFVNAGYETFKYLSLQVMSPYAPKLEIAGNEERISMNVLILANPGSGKTGMIKKAMAISPYGKHEMIQKQTQAALQDLVSRNKEGTNLIVNDLKTIIGDSSLLKTYETVIADGFISKDVSGKTQKNDDVRAAMIAGAVPDDISRQMYGGLIFRVIPIQIKYDKDQQKEVMDHIAGNMSAGNKSGLSTEEISLYYDMIYDAMKGKFNDVPKIVGYEVPKEHSETVKGSVQEALDELRIGQMDKISFFRQLQDGFRMMVLHSLLNLPNREIVNVRENENGVEVGEILVTEQDAVVASGLVQQLLGTLNGFVSDDDVQEQFAELDKFDSGNEYGTSGAESKYFNNNTGVAK